jgi:hypothetical protein
MRRRQFAFAATCGNERASFCKHRTDIQQSQFEVEENGMFSRRAAPLLEATDTEFEMPGGMMRLIHEDKYIDAK